MNLPHLSEQHGSNLATIKSASENARIGKDGCFSDAPWNDWKCSWMGLTDQRDESTQEWASGAAFSSSAAFWGEYEPMATAGNAQDCGAVCHGGNLAGYTGDFWVDLECKSEYAFCCDEATFVKDAGTASKDSFLNELAAAKAAKPVAPVPVDPDPYAGRRLCFSTKQTWADAQVGRERRRGIHTRVRCVRCVRCVLCAMCDVCGVLCAVCYILLLTHTSMSSSPPPQSLCKSVGSHLITIHNQAELDHAGKTVQFSRVPDVWGLDWKVRGGERKDT